MHLFLRPLVAASVIFLLTLVLVGLAPFPALAAVLSLSALTLLVLCCGSALPWPSGVSTGGRMLFSLVSWESVVPAGLALGLLASGLVSPSGALSEVVSRQPVLWLIMTFALLSLGMARSGLFRYVAVWTLVLSRGSPFRLAVGFYLLSSVLTVLTSNDVVVLVLVPLILEVSLLSGARDVRVVVVSCCFVPANTASMFLPFASPSNVIVALAVGLDFPGYVGLMAVPAALAASSSLAVAAWGLFLGRSREGSGVRSPGHPVLAGPFRPAMAFQSLLFVGAVASYSAAMTAGWSFWTVSLPFTFLGLVSLALVRAPGQPPSRTVLSGLASLPWGVLGFALSFFIVARACVDLVVGSGVPGLVSALPQAAAFASLMGLTALLVNVMNDLPASALVGGVLASGSVGPGTLALQAVIASVNVGCYLTPPGALAGVLLMQVLRRDGARLGLVVPGAGYILRVGALHFTVCVAVLSLVLPAFQ